MRRLILMVMAIALLVPSLLQGEVVAVLDEVGKARTMAADGERLYVTQGTEILIYSLKDYKFIKKFGKAGEGPEEFLRFVFVTPLKDRLLINSLGKVSYWTKDGVFQEETKSPSGIAGGFGYFPVKNKFVGRGGTQEDDGVYQTYSIFDEKLNKGKEVFRVKVADKGLSKISILKSINAYTTDLEKLYINGEKGFVVNAVDDNGNLVFTIERKDFKPTKFTSEDEQVFRKIMKKQSAQQYEFMKDRLEFGDYYPEIAILQVDMGAKKLYVFSFGSKRGVYDCYVYDLNGKFVKKSNLTVALQDALQPYPFTAWNGNFYQLIDNDEEEQWELHKTTIL